ncbi:MAG: peroxide stress protein YaaA [Lewinellaceae bacterium]|nr:peroxide stress protein YaaA [Phaeodactylibacter sp.]MCB0612636.1 peroxide stress protein YaaA [Phaeodactylibacter sp.]MCB9350021.1 peroxide stress protein YaaA [Lewinellaceae bacterium]
MILLLSPSKTLDYSEPEHRLYSQPRLLEKSEFLVDLLREKSEEELKNLMKISDELAAVNAERYQDFETPFDLTNAKQALLAFKGDVYLGLEAADLGPADLEFAQSHLRILSGLYGLLRPLDLMQPYRLEMGARLQIGKNKGLYNFWGEEITRLLNEDLDATNGKAVVNLASREYFSAVKPALLKGRLFHIHFKENRKGAYQVIAFYAKKARGAMASYAIRNRIENPEALKGFDWEGYAFNEALSSDYELTFTR